MMLEEAYRKVPITGRADAVCLTGRAATCLIEYKFTKAYRLHPDWKVQLLIYGHLLESTGFQRI